MKLKLSWGIRSEWNKALRDLVLPDKPRTPELLLGEYVRQVRGNRLVLTRDPKVASPDGPSGMWVTQGDVDLVWIHPGAKGVLERRIIAHELGHMVNGDRPDPLSLTSLMRLCQSMSKHTAPSLWDSAFQGAVCRTDFSDPLEQRAEKFSYFAEGWLTRSRTPGSDLVGNVQESLDTRNEFR